MKKKSMTILLFHGSRSPSTLTEARVMAGVVPSGKPESPCEAAFLQFAEPSLEQVVTRAVDDGFDSITIFPMFVLTGTHVETDIPALLTGFRKKFPEVVFHLMPHLGRDQEFLDWVAAKIQRMA